jgi:hypothetical protein
MKYKTKYDCEWIPAKGISAAQAAETLRKFPQVRDGASLNALAKIIGAVSDVREMADGTATWYEFSLADGHWLVRGAVNFD